MKNWKNTEIWKHLESIKCDESDIVKSFLIDPKCMDHIETILNKGGTTPKDFTLHDADHSFRVAQRMWEIIPIETRRILSEFELALLLLSAYLHDIGMTPEYNQVNNHFLCITSDAKKSLKPNEKIEFQRWLDEVGEQIDIDKDIIGDNEKASELVTFYSRHKHNDWSEDWIRNNLVNLQLSNYTNWLNDLVDICKSHHFGLSDLKNDNFNPLRINGKIIHKRYVAMCLRLADVMEIDPERAPDVLLKHRNVISGSMSHWLKEKFTSIDIVNNEIIITALPTRAFIQKAIEDVADQIEYEANLCNTLQSEIPLRNISPSNDLEHEWKILPTVYRKIKEAGDYEYIDGTFKPNSKKLLQLFAGTELYGNPILAIRELIQNSIDAVKVQIGYRVLEDQLKKSKEIDALKKKYYVELTVKEENDEYWIKCKDNGVGMDKEIIKKSFLVGGAIKRHELLELERNCNKIGYNLETTGQFGIGVMSYFMLADKAIIRTKKSIQAGNYEGNGWEFEIDGLSDFGELRKVDLKDNGTEINLRIKKELISLVNDSIKMIEFINKVLNRIPCNFSFVPLVGNIISYAPGWCKDVEFFKTQLIDRFNATSSPKFESANDFVTDEMKSFVRVNEIRKKEVAKEFYDSIEFISKKGKFKNGKGYYRIHIPIFRNKNGKSFAFFFETLIKGKLYLQRLNGAFLFNPYNQFPNISWKGICVNKSRGYFRRLPLSNCYVEIDLTDNKSFQISVSRHEIIYRNSFNLILKEIEEKIQKLILLNQSLFNNSIYSLFNHFIAPFIKLSSRNQFWTTENGYAKDFIKFEKISFPVIFETGPVIRNVRKELYLNKNFNMLESIRGLGKLSSRETFSIDQSRFYLDRAVYHPDTEFKISFLKTKPFKTINEHSLIGNTAHFPPKWKKIIAFLGPSQTDTVLNIDSQYFKYFNVNDFEFIDNFFKMNEKLGSETGEAILKDKSKCFCFILYMILKKKKKAWNAVALNNPLYLEKLWKRIFKNENEVLYFFSDNIDHTRLITLSKTSWNNIVETKELFTLLPVPTKEWRIEVKRKYDPKYYTKIKN